MACDVATQLFEDSLMAQVHAIEVADGKHAARRFRPALRAANQLHVSVLSVSGFSVECLVSFKSLPGGGV